jgi:hypothetical protein
VRAWYNLRNVYHAMKNEQEAINYHKLIQANQVWAGGRGAFHFLSRPPCPRDTRGGSVTLWQQRKPGAMSGASSTQDPSGQGSSQASAGKQQQQQQQQVRVGAQALPPQPLAGLARDSPG